MLLSLQKSRSLDTDSIRGNEPPPQQQQQQQHDARRQLDTVQQEVGVLREKLVSLEGENESLQEENRRLQLQAGRKAPAVTTDDAALQNIELKDGVKKLEKENAVLRKQLTTLDRQANKLSREVVSRKKIKSESCLESESAASRDLRKQLRALEDETKRLRKKMAEVETQNAKLDRDLQRHKKKEAKNNKEKREGIDELKDKLLDLESETSKFDNKCIYVFLSKYARTVFDVTWCLFTNQQPTFRFGVEYHILVEHSYLNPISFYLSNRHTITDYAFRTHTVKPELFYSTAKKKYSLLLEVFSPLLKIFYNLERYVLPLLLTSFLFVDIGEELPKGVFLPKNYSDLAVCQHQASPYKNQFHFERVYICGTVRNYSTYIPPICLSGGR